MSHATRRAGPFGISVGPLDRLFWSESFYRATMRLTDQTVLMAYDTTLDSSKPNVGFVRHQTELLLSWADRYRHHEVLIGVPADEGVPALFNPEAENITNASLGVRAAPEERPDWWRSFRGVAVYAEWVTDPDEWAELAMTWNASAGP